MSVTNDTNATAKGRAPWMPFWGTDFMASTLGWSASERGAYMILLWSAWEGDGLPAEPERLFRIDPDIRAAWHLLEDKFPLHTDGKRRNHRQERERAEMREQGKRNADKAKRAAAARWDATSNAPSNAHAMLGSCQTQTQTQTHTQSLSETETKRNTLTADGGEPVSVQVETRQRSKRLGTDAEFELWWKVYPRKVGKVAARKAWFKALPSVKAYAQVIDEAVAEAMQEAVAAYVADPETKKLEPQYIPHPATWLNEGRYIDILEKIDAR